jgi:hypothetical protein
MKNALLIDLAHETIDSILAGFAVAVYERVGVTIQILRR